MTAAAWLGCGGLVATVAWVARPDGLSSGAVAATSGLCGGLLGGASAALFLRAGIVSAALSMCAAVVGAIVVLNLTVRTSTTGSEPSSRNRALAWVWSWACLLESLLVSTIIGVTAGVATKAPTIGVLAALAAMLAIYWQAKFGEAITRSRSYGSRESSAEEPTDARRDGRSVS